MVTILLSLSIWHEEETIILASETLTGYYKETPEIEYSHMIKNKYN